MKKKYFSFTKAKQIGTAKLFYYCNFQFHTTEYLSHTFKRCLKWCTNACILEDLNINYHTINTFTDQETVHKKNINIQLHLLLLLSLQLLLLFKLE